MGPEITAGGAIWGREAGVDTETKPAYDLEVVVLLLLFLSRFRYGPHIEAAVGVGLVVAGIAFGPVWVYVGGVLLVGAVVSAVRRSRGRDQYSRRINGHDGRVGLPVKRSA